MARFDQANHQGLAMSAGEAADYVLGQAEPRPQPTTAKATTVLTRCVE